MDKLKDFKVIEGYDVKYYINKNGEIIREDGLVLKHTVNMFGYMSVMLLKDNKQCKRYVHRLVAETFLPNPDSKPHVHHIDENKQNNHISNLRWVTAMEHGGLKSKASKIKFRETYRKNKAFRENK